MLGHGGVLIPGAVSSMGGHTFAAVEDFDSGGAETGFQVLGGALDHRRTAPSQDNLADALFTSPESALNWRIPDNLTLRGHHDWPDKATS